MNMNKLSFVLASACLGAIITMAPGASAEERVHDGFYLSLQTGLGYLSSSAEIGGFDQSLSGLTVSSGLLMGGTVGPVVIGGGMTFDRAFSPSVKQGDQEVELDDVELYLINLGVFADYYPDPTRGLHFVGMFGWGGLEASVGGDVGGSDPTGMILGLGAGYDFWIADEWSVGPLGRFMYAPLSLNDVDYDTIQFTLVADFKLH